MFWDVTVWIDCYYRERIEKLLIPAPDPSSVLSYVAAYIGSQPDAGGIQAVKVEIKQQNGPVSAGPFVCQFSEEGLRSARLA